MDSIHNMPHWSKDADYSRVPFFIRRMNTRGRITVSEVPSASLPLVGFLYLTEGEVLAEVDGIQFLCESGHLLLIPEGRPFAIRYYADAIGYTGGFRSDLLSRPEVVLPWIEPVQQAFWFDEAVFVGELFNMLALSSKGDVDFLAKGIDLLVSRVRRNPGWDAEDGFRLSGERVFHRPAAAGPGHLCRGGVCHAGAPEPDGQEGHGQERRRLDRHRPAGHGQAAPAGHGAARGGCCRRRGPGRFVLFFPLLQASRRYDADCLPEEDARIVLILARTFLSELSVYADLCARNVISSHISTYAFSGERHACHILCDGF
jgi:hypothetical protein